MKKKHLIMLVSILVLSGIIGGIVLGNLLRGAKTPQSMTPIILNLTYIPNIQFAPIYAAIENGYFAEAGLDISLSYGNEADLIALIGSGNQQFMIASGEQVLLSRSQGVPVVYVFQWYRDYPVGVVSFTNSGIQNPSDMIGKKIGIPGLYGANYIGFEALLGVSGLSDADVNLVPIGFTQAETLAAGKVDAIVAYVANEPVVLTAMGYDVAVMPVADYVDLVGNGLVTNEALIRDNPTLVQDMVNALSKGIEFALDNPNETFEISKKYVDNLESADKNVQMAIFQASTPLWQTNPPGLNDQVGWKNMQSLLLRIGLLSSPTNLEQAYTNVFIK